MFSDHIQLKPERFTCFLILLHLTSLLGFVIPRYCIPSPFLVWFVSKIMMEIVETRLLPVDCLMVTNCNAATCANFKGNFSGPIGCFDHLGVSFCFSRDPQDVFSCVKCKNIADFFLWAICPFLRIWDFHHVRVNYNEIDVDSWFARHTRLSSRSSICVIIICASIAGNDLGHIKTRVWSSR